MDGDVKRVLVTGWPSFRDGEATAGDVRAMETVRDALAEAGLRADLAWSPVLSPGGLARSGQLPLDEADPARYSHLVFACGPLNGPQIADLHDRYAHCRRVAVGVSVIDPSEPAVTGFDVVLPRDAPGSPPAGDLAAVRDTPGPARSGAGGIPVAGVIMVAGQAEYAARAAHERVSETLGGWLRDCDLARLPLETRIDPRDWRLCATAPQFEAIVGRLDLVITTRLHGLVFALRNGVPALAVDPVAGGAKVAAQARAWHWPAVVTTSPGGDLDRGELSRWRDWCLSPAGTASAARAAAGPPATPLDGLLTALSPGLGPAPRPRGFRREAGVEEAL